MIDRRFGLRTKVTADLYLDTIQIVLDEVSNLPKIKLTGRVRTGNRRVDAVTSVTIDTAYLPPSGAAFIDEMKAAFKAGSPTRTTETEG